MPLFKFVRFVVIGTSLWLSNAAAIDQPTLTLATHNLCPYGCYPVGVSKANNPQFSGIAVKTVQCVVAQMNWRLEIKVLPWTRAQQMAQSGEVDGFFAASQKAERDQFAVMSDTIAEQNWQWFLLKDSVFDPSDADFKSQARVGGFNGSNMLAWLEGNDFHVVARPPGTEKLLRTLLAKRVDAILANERVMTELLVRRNQLAEVKSYPLLNKPLGVYFDKRFLAQHPDFLSQFNAHIETCRHD
ncbi:transporter substrate-binding domain-containing protein [Neiella sp. HB171785]|uniref:Transporter substrate-binding domain-containing protein n=1 Tax=Neiella litorisoli TaxID=2771431 RepID=A0A8J6QHH3_9GAMM|nr:transporter substrate-binding domain-containing protein [Neiella litorisoli]MBD1388527.1 transporter substrate-binding domain-containing protein [Neiella litorisoli]